MDDRLLLLGAFRAGIAGVDPEAATIRTAQRFDFSSARRAIVIAAGKAAVPMARGFASIAEPSDGVIVAPDFGDAPLPVIVAGHPVPNEGSVDGARRALQLASSAGPDDVVVCLISGGASALLAAPARGLTLADLSETNRVLLESGADIVETNAVRKHLSAVKGGRLAAAAGRAKLVTLVLSDVVGDSLDVIASGPTVPDPTTYADALAVVDRHGVFEAIPGPVLGHLERGRRGLIDETPKEPHPRHEIDVIGSGSVAAEAAAAFLHARDIAARIVSTRLVGEAREAAVLAVATPSEDGEVLIFAGETTVTVRGTGRGGRNQEAALAAALEIDGRDVTFLAGGTDGIDGPTDAAGGLVDGGTIDRGLAANFDPFAALADNDTYPFLAAAGDLIVIGPTGTNVADLWMMRRHTPETPSTPRE
jgi:hydroxypyruvate reductase